MSMKRVGFTTTVPVEIIFSAGFIPVDLNNIFITDSSPYKYIERAEDDGLPRNSCNWIKGIYSAVMDGAVDEVVAVTQGDCSNTHAIMELFTARGIKVHSFGYPFGVSDSYEYLKNEIQKLCALLGTSLESVADTVRETDLIRKKLVVLDELTVKCKVSGFENHLWLVSSTDFNGDYKKFEAELDKFLDIAEKRVADEHSVRLGFIGVPPIFSNIYDFIHTKGGDVVFNEVQRQFSIPYFYEDYVRRYLDYTYPYDIFKRIKDISRQIALRKVDGVIHYVQSFCYRQIQDVVIKNKLNIPVLTIEGNEPGEVDARTKIRIESFIEMLKGKKYA